MGMDEFGQMEEGGLAAADEGEEMGGFQLRQGHLKGFVDGDAVGPVEFFQNHQDVVALVFGDPAPFVHEIPDGGFRQKGEEVPGIAEAPGHPDETDVPPVVLGSQGNADADRDSHDLAGFHEFVGRLRWDEVVVDHRQAADAFDPGIHDQVGGGLASLRVRVMHMVVESDLIPGLRHLQQMIALQFTADETGPSRYGHAEVVRQFELPLRVPLHPNQFLHDLEEDPCGIPAEEAVGDVHHLVMQGPQGAQPVGCLADLQRVEEVRHCIGDAEGLRCGHLLDPVGVQVGIEQILEVLPGGFPVEHLPDHLEQFVVFPVKKEFSVKCLHGIDLSETSNFSPTVFAGPLFDHVDEMLKNFQLLEIHYG
jgi:hypothetical protein